MEKKIKISAFGVKPVQQKTLKEESLQFQTGLDEQENQELVYHHCEEHEQFTGFQHTPPGSQQVNQVSEMFQQLYIAKSPAAS